MVARDSVTGLNARLDEQMRSMWPHGSGAVGRGGFADHHRRRDPASPGW